MADLEDGTKDRTKDAAHTPATDRAEQGVTEVALGRVRGGGKYRLSDGAKDTETGAWEGNQDGEQAETGVPDGVQDGEGAQDGVREMAQDGEQDGVIETMSAGAWDRSGTVTVL